MKTVNSGSKIRDGLAAALPAAVLSGIPSTLYALVAKRDPLEASVAAGSILLPRENHHGRLLVGAVPVHLALSALWGIVLAAVLPRRTPLLEGTLAGVVITTLDLGIIGRRYPRIRALKPLPQLADHVAFGVVAAISLSRRDGPPR
jgi:hypothetical protein